MLNSRLELLLFLQKKNTLFLLGLLQRLHLPLSTVAFFGDVLYPAAHSSFSLGNFLRNQHRPDQFEDLCSILNLIQLLNAYIMSKVKTLACLQGIWHPQDSVRPFAAQKISTAYLLHKLVFSQLAMKLVHVIDCLRDVCAARSKKVRTPNGTVSNCIGEALLPFWTSCKSFAIFSTFAFIAANPCMFAIVSQPPSGRTDA